MSSAQRTPFQQLVRLVKPEKADVIVVFVFAVVIGIFMLATPIAVQSIVNSVALGGTIQPLVAIAIFLAAALTFSAVIRTVQVWVVELMQRRFFVRAVSDLSTRLPHVELSEYDRGFGSERVNRFFDILTLQKAASKLLIDALGVVLAVVVGMTVLAFYHPFLLAFDVVMLVIIGGLALGPLRQGERTAMVESSAKYDVAAWLEQIAGNPLTFRSSGAHNWIYHRSDDLSRRWVKARKAHFRVLISQIAGAFALEIIASTSLLAIGGWLVIQGSLSLGQLVAAELIVTAVVSSVAKMGRYLETWYDLMAGVAKLSYVLDVPIEDIDGERHEHGQRGKDGKIEFLNVSLKSVVGPMQIEGVDLSIQPGERIALTGLDGATRLAFVDLLWDLRQPDSGVMRLDSRDLRDLAPDFLRREIAVVSQIEVIHGTVRENVMLERPFVDNDAVRDALRLMGLREVFAAFDGGLDAMMHPGARLISDDDLRRLMLARALAGDPTVLVIDSAGAGAGAKFRTAIDAVLKRHDDRTIIVLTNDVSDEDQFDRVIDLTDSCGVSRAAAANARRDAGSDGDRGAMSA